MTTLITYIHADENLDGINDHISVRSDAFGEEPLIGDYRGIELCRILYIASRPESVARAEQLAEQFIASLQMQRTDEESGEYSTPPSLGDEDSTIRINNDGTEFSLAIEALEKGENTTPTYLGWRMGFLASRDYFSASKADFVVSCPSARNLITALHLLETNGVTDPAPDEVL